MFAGYRSRAHPSRKVRGKCQSAGFTLLELLIVLAIAAGAYALAAPRVSSGLATVKLKSAAREIASALRYTRSQAISTLQDAAFFLDVEAHRYRVSGREKDYRISEALHLKLLTAESEITGEGQGNIRFFPDGSSTGGRITVSAGGRKRLVDVNWLTGQVVIRKEE